MKKIAFATLVLLVFFSSEAQKLKVDKIQFCGKIYSKTGIMRNMLQEQFEFLQLQEKDTIVDIGAASGWYEGAYSAISPLSNIHFILMDIDSSCLNQRKVDNMIKHYSGLKGSPITNSFELVLNTADSLNLPSGKFKKVWLMNVLHEIPDKKKMIRDIHEILQPGGELILLEYIPKNSGDLHGGCKKPLLGLEEWKALIENQNFTMTEFIQTNKVKKRMTINLIRFIKPHG